METFMSKIRLVCLVIAMFAYVVAVASTIAAHASGGRTAPLQPRQTTLNLESRTSATLTRVASLETGNLSKPWPAPIGHRQPRAADVATSTPDAADFLDRENASVDRRIRGVCIGC